MSYRDKARVARLSLTDEEQQALLDATPTDIAPPSGYLPPAQVNEQLAHVDTLLKEGKRKEARTLLAQVQYYAMKNPAFWWRVAKASSRRSQAIRALQKVVELRPGDQRARAMLNKLKGKTEEPKPARKKSKQTTKQRVIVGLKLAFFAVFAAGVVSVLTLIIMHFL